MSQTTFDNPFAAAGKWWRGNLHTHTTVSDGEGPPAETAARYRGLGYDFLAITDHNAFLEPFDAPDGLLVVPGIEYGLGRGDPKRMWHMVAVGIAEPAPDDYSLKVLHEHLRKHAAFYWLAHPYWSTLPEDEMIEVAGVTAVEIYNGVCERAIDRGESASAWDIALGCGMRLNGLAVDDAHAVTDAGRGWIMLRAESLDLETVYDALRRGLFYASTGPEINDLRIAGDCIEVETGPARAITFVARSPAGKRVAAGEGQLITSAAYAPRGKERYVRIVVEDADGRRAWTNPIFLDAAPGRT